MPLPDIAFAHVECMGAHYRISARHSSSMPASRSVRTASSSHIDECTSPIWAFFRKNMHSRDWPMPPPAVSGSSPFSSALWNGRYAQSSWPLAQSCSISDFSSTRMPIDDISIAQLSSG